MKRKKKIPTIIFLFLFLSLLLFLKVWNETNPPLFLFLKHFYIFFLYLKIFYSFKSLKFFDSFNKFKTMTSHSLEGNTSALIPKSGASKFLWKKHIGSHGSCSTSKSTPRRSIIFYAPLPKRWTDAPSLNWSTNVFWLNSCNTLIMEN